MFIDQCLPPKPQFSVNELPDLSEQSPLLRALTPAKVTVKALLGHNAKVYFVCHSEENARAAMAELRNETGREGLFLQVDFADLNFIKHAADDFTR
ncbi:uncharacterized protein BT62DRAFT_1072209 [Guyanagaster necrorhizus]|uniref:Uncharacterized protein n=1 Tax=Guyanagaster necrorhizus TaxID=856835 RepID=A0A9P7W2V4_9AGAR|nr:uncharacterized protein BT62DRAFT_1072209 [Guyanagaster necrorhizus MCA 3950]KAG7451663.1 hypothetical protein BT62DRAFT_1072209 [Guyanagaster necrorhizus MCA 3950]